MTWRYVVPPQPGWPTSLDCHVTYRLGDDGLTVSTRARNVGSTRCLYGTGAHPYLTAGTTLVDGATLTLPAARCFDTDGHGIPIGSRAVDGTPADLREPRPIGDRVLDTAYADLARDADGRWRARLRGRTAGCCSGPTRPTATHRSSPATRFRRPLGAAVWRSSR